MRPVCCLALMIMLLTTCGMETRTRASTNTRYVPLALKFREELVQQIARLPVVRVYSLPPSALTDMGHYHQPQWAPLVLASEHPLYAQMSLQP